MTVRKICCLGGGDLGVLLSVAIALKCPEIRVVFADPNPKHIFKWNAKLIPDGYIDPGLFDVLRKVQNKNLYFTTNERDAIRESEILFLVTNPDLKDFGEGKGVAVNLTCITEEAQVIVDNSETDKIIVECSCLPQKTYDCLEEFFLYNGKPNVRLPVVSNPVFFDRKAGMKSVFFPDRVMIGVNESSDGYSSAQVVSNIYERWVPSNCIVRSTTQCVELTQIVSYALLGQKLASMYTLKAICDKTNISMKKLTLQLQKDSQVGGLTDFSLNIGKSFNAIKILSQMFIDINLPEFFDYWIAVLKIFASEEMKSLEKIIENFKQPNFKVTLFGFDENDILLPDLSLKICDMFLTRNIQVQIHDPKVTQKSVERHLAPLEKKYSKVGIESRVTVCDDPYKATKGSQLVVIHSYREGWIEIDLKKVFEEMNKPAYLLDHFNLFGMAELQRIGFQVHNSFQL